MTGTIAAREREAARYERILDATVDAVLVVDPADLTVEYANRGAAEQVGRDAASLVGAPLASVLDVERSRIAATVRGVVETGRRHTASLAFRGADAGSVPAEVLFERVDLGDDGPRVVVVARDVSERVEAQARLRRLAESEHARAAELNAVIGALGDGVLVVGAGGRIRLANPAAARLVPGVATYADLVAALDDPRGLAPELGQPAGPVEVRLPGQTDRWVELSTYPVRAGPGAVEPADTIVLLRDVTATRRGRASRETFVHMLSHELRTPVTTIYGAAQVLWRRGGALDDETRTVLLSDIHAEAERLHRLVEDVIALTRFGEDDASVGVEPVLLQRVVPPVAAAEEARWPGMHVSVHVGADVPTVTADRTYVEQVVRNLVSNAAKYAGPGAEVAVTVENEGDEAVVRVLDRGPGFGTIEGSRLFDLYYRSPESAANVGGAGIGLFVCARLVEAMGGRIWARPRADGGAEFGFSLPVLRDDDGGG